MPVVIDKELYNLVKQHADEVYEKPSAYKSGYIADEVYEKPSAYKSGYIVKTYKKN